MRLAPGHSCRVMYWPRRRTPGSVPQCSLRFPFPGSLCYFLPIGESQQYLLPIPNIYTFRKKITVLNKWNHQRLGGGCKSTKQKVIETHPKWNVLRQFEICTSIKTKQNKKQSDSFRIPYHFNPYPNSYKTLILNPNPNPYLNSNPKPNP